ncbi:hypothetical protein [Jannaschia rubra]|uniref:DUF2125 domain-containing protein n=1 Tax=Jannaschia rubra TaxID=282197 RepID=A0A0M6XT72_9RHOB|nr:hypothetical protein [Jannaschia rubra]CTQ34290.1 hypothetical protein JAN5088_03084 [Jannaschia rubra]SFG18692.1 hypothetical protein SAMN04488517_10353 [Jannaschia rubra]
MRWLALVAVLTALPAGAATRADCRALLERMEDATAGQVSSVAGACRFRNVTLGLGADRWTARTVTLSGDISALPDALPDRLTGGAESLAPAPEGVARPRLIRRAPDRPGLAVAFDLQADNGSVRINSLSLRAGDAAQLQFSARLTGVPQTLPFVPAAAMGLRLDRLDATVDMDGTHEDFGRMLLWGGPQTVGDRLTRLRTEATRWLAEQESGDQAQNLAAARAFTATLPRPRGVLNLRVGGNGISAVQVGSLASGLASADFVARLARSADLHLSWTPDAP